MNLVTKDCDCNAEKAGLFCPIPTTHANYKAGIEAVTNQVKNEAEKTHTMKKLSPVKYDYKKAITIMKDSPLYDGVSDCVFDALESMNYLKVSLLGLAMLALLF